MYYIRYSLHVKDEILLYNFFTQRRLNYIKLVIHIPTAYLRLQMLYAESRFFSSFIKINVKVYTASY